MEFDVDHHVGAVSREIASGEREGKPTRTVRASRSFDTDIDDAWDALVNPERIPRWFSPVSGDLRLGGRYQIQGNAGGAITECEPPRRLALDWEFGGEASWVAVTLSPDGQGRTRLELEHIAVVDDKFAGFWDQFGPGAVGVGWDLSLLGLAEHVENGWDKPPEADTEWPSSDNGKAFIGGSSDGWRAASVAFGTDPEAAREASERTAGFYTGG